ncbi:AAA family ATPase [Kitasatospora sp. NPDC050543]|uniref:AAA family ATPase n=1 Tax=Kitasatospora sp. NPDC050543 TaxID=3364054 RepID=UPI00379FDED9
MSERTEVEASSPPRVPPRVPTPGRAPAAPGAPPLRPHALHDLRRGRGPAVLNYPPGDVLVVAGLPGSGKSTLLRRCVQAARVIDSQQVRAEYAARVPAWLPYAVYRPFVRLDHYRRLRRALLAGGSLAVHDCGALPWVRQWLARTAARQGRRLHLVLLEASPLEAREGQLARGQTVSAYAFARHRSAARALRHRLAGSGAPPDGCASAVVLDRAGARALREIAFRAA